MMRPVGARALADMLTCVVVCGGCHGEGSAPRTPRPPQKRITVAAAPASSRIVGLLFYDGVTGATWGTTHPTGLHIYPGGVVPRSGGGRTKLLWIDYRRRARGTLSITGTRLDAPGEFRESYLVLGPSIIDVPTRGCWRVTLRTRTATAHVTMLAVAPYHATSSSGGEA